MESMYFNKKMSRSSRLTHLTLSLLPLRHRALRSTSLVEKKLKIKIKIIQIVGNGEGRMTASISAMLLSQQYTTFQRGWDLLPRVRAQQPKARSLRRTTGWMATWFALHCATVEFAQYADYRIGLRSYRGPRGHRHRRQITHTVTILLANRLAAAAAAASISSTCEKRVDIAHRCRP